MSLGTQMVQDEKMGGFRPHEGVLYACRDYLGARVPKSCRLIRRALSLPEARAKCATTVSALNLRTLLLPHCLIHSSHIQTQSDKDGSRYEGNQMLT